MSTRIAAAPGHSSASAQPLFVSKISGATVQNKTTIVLGCKNSSSKKKKKKICESCHANRSIDEAIGTLNTAAMKRTKRHFHKHKSIVINKAVKINTLTWRFGRIELSLLL